MHSREGKSLSQKMRKMGNKKKAQLESDLVFRAITKGNEANGLWQIV